MIFKLTNFVDGLFAYKDYSLNDYKNQLYYINDSKNQLYYINDSNTVLTLARIFGKSYK